MCGQTSPFQGPGQLDFDVKLLVFQDWQFFFPLASRAPRHLHADLISPWVWVGRGCDWGPGRWKPGPALELTGCPVVRVESGLTAAPVCWGTVPLQRLFSSVAWYLRSSVFVGVGGDTGGGLVSSVRSVLFPGGHCLMRRPAPEKGFPVLGLGCWQGWGCWNKQACVGTVTLKVEGLEYLPFLVPARPIAELAGKPPACPLRGRKPHKVSQGPPWVPTFHSQLWRLGARWAWKAQNLGREVSSTLTSRHPTRSSAEDDPEHETQKQRMV